MALPAMSVLPNGWIVPGAAKYFAAGAVKQTLIASTVTGGIFIPIAVTACWVAYKVVKHDYVDEPARRHEVDMRGDELADMREQIKKLQADALALQAEAPAA